MYDLVTATAAIQRGFESIVSRLDKLTDAEWQTQVRCAGWTVADLAAHVIGASRGQADALRRAVGGGTELARLDPPDGREPRVLMDALKDGYEQLFAALRAVPPEAADGLVPLPFGLLPAPVALQIVPLEYGFHDNDLAWALGDQAPLPADVSASLLAIAPGLLGLLAAGTPVSPVGVLPPGPMSFRLTSPAGELLASYDGAAWSFAPGPDPAAVTCEIAGDDSSLALFIMGRIDAGHADLAVSDADAAAQFKQFFPGP
jgi:uncharacterized protein (TIGR03083 family)